MSEFYTLAAKKSSGEILEMESFKGKPILIINTATKCGLTPQFDGLEKLHQTYKAKGLVVLGFPCNQFAGQEPETNETMESACKINHGVTFQLTEKIDVNGEHTHPVFQYLKKKKGGFLTSRIKWNFTKFLVDKEGKVIKRYAPTTVPSKIAADIQKII
ncbi:MAG: glutathione peroxidase [Bacteroidetes bacterium]|jgi:glutathione peroxidase|nr:glutathione peroxidase [Bacteroidota bacterium]